MGWSIYKKVLGPFDRSHNIAMRKSFMMEKIRKRKMPNFPKNSAFRFPYPPTIHHQITLYTKKILSGNRELLLTNNFKISESLSETQLVVENNFSGYIKRWSCLFSTPLNGQLILIVFFTTLNYFITSWNNN